MALHVGISIHSSSILGLTRRYVYVSRSNTEDSVLASSAIRKRTFFLLARESLLYFIAHSRLCYSTELLIFFLSIWVLLVFSSYFSFFFFFYFCFLFFFFTLGRTLCSYFLSLPFFFLIKFIFKYLPGVTETWSSRKKNGQIKITLGLNNGRRLFIRWYRKHYCTQSIRILWYDLYNQPTLGCKY